MRLQREDTEQRFLGIQIAPQAPPISHLFFADDSIFFTSVNDSQLIYLKNILEDYREASGQKVNFDKSSIIYGKAITEQEKSRIKAETGISKEGGEGIYLGLPEAFVGSKIDTLRFLEGKMTARFTSWKTKFLSHGGKETLLKSVAQALLTYAMSCFLLPKTTVQRLNQSFSKFWWKNQQSGKGIHWLSWERLCKHKTEGGMGFRDIEGTNLALLGKQYWRLASNPGSLLARTLSGRYYPASTITQAKLGSRPSYGWRSIMESKALMHSGLKFEIGNAAFDMWSEPWVMDNGPRPPNALPSVHYQNWDINDFRTWDSDQWHLHRLHQVFDANEVARILQSKPGGRGSKQGFSWIHTDSGDYSVKSGYKQWLSMKHHGTNPVPEHMVDYSAIFTSIWKLSTSPKLKNFLWKCLHSALPVGNALRKKRMTLQGSCVLCGDDNEDIVHMLFLCPCARAFWSLSPYVSILADSSCSAHGKIYMCMKLDDAMQEDDKELWTWLLWRLWKMRNEKAFQNRQPDVVKAYHMARADHEEWKSSQVSTATVAATVSTAANTMLHWIRPPANVFKCNIDATWQEDHDRCGAAWILRDEDGRVRFWGAKTYPKLLSSLEAEATTLAWAVMCIGNMGYREVIFESDSAILVDAVNNSSTWSRLLSYISEIQSWTQQEHRQFSFYKVNRKQNQAADCLAKYGKELPMYFGTIDNSIPLWLSPFLDQTL